MRTEIGLYGGMCLRAPGGMAACRRTPSRCLAGWLLLVLLAAAQLDAAVKTWTGAGGDNNWSTAANWGGVAPVDNADDLVFTGSARLNITNDLTADWRFRTLTFATNAAAFVLNGNPIRATTAVNLEVVNKSPYPQTVNLDINALARPGVWTTEAGDLLMNGTLTCSYQASIFNANAPSTLTKEGGGTLTLQGLGNFTHANPGLKILNGTVLLDLEAGGSLTNTTRLEYGLGSSSGGNITKQGGTLIVRGKPSGTSLQAFAGLTLYPSTSRALITVDPNGGGGTTAAFGSWWDNRADGGTLCRFDLSRSGAGATLMPPLGTGRLIGPWCTVTDTQKTGFATTNAAGQLVRNTTLYEYTWFPAPTTAILATNYYVSGNGTLSLIGRLWTLTIQGGGTVSGGSYAYASGVVMEEGVSDYTLAIPTFGFTASTWLHQHSLAGSLVFDCKLNGIFHKAGPGKVVLKKDTVNNITLNVREGPVEVRATLSGVSHHVFTGGSLSGYGTVSSNLTIHPGGCLEGTHATNNALAVRGHLLLKERSMVAMALTSTTFQPLHVSGTVTNLGANLALALDYRPRSGDTIPLLTCGQAISGAFRTVNGAPLGPGGTFVLDYNAEPCKFSLVSGAASVAARFISRPGTLMMVR